MKELTSFDDLYKTQLYCVEHCTYGRALEVVVDGELSVIFTDVPIVTLIPMYNLLLNPTREVPNLYVVNEDFLVFGHEKLTIHLEPSTAIRITEHPELEAHYGKRRCRNRSSKAKVVVAGS